MTHRRRVGGRRQGNEPSHEPELLVGYFPLPVHLSCLGSVIILLLLLIIIAISFIFEVMIQLCHYPLPFLSPNPSICPPPSLSNSLPLWGLDF